MLIQRTVDSDEAFYVDLEKGFLIRIKTNIECKPVSINGDLTHEILFGAVTVEYRE